MSGPTSPAGLRAWVELPGIQRSEDTTTALARWVDGAGSVVDQVAAVGAYAGSSLLFPASTNATDLAWLAQLFGVPPLADPVALRATLLARSSAARDGSIPNLDGIVASYLQPPQPMPGSTVQPATVADVYPATRALAGQVNTYPRSTWFVLYVAIRADEDPYPTSATSAADFGNMLQNLPSWPAGFTAVVLYRDATWGAEETAQPTWGDSDGYITWGAIDSVGVLPM